MREQTLARLERAVLGVVYSLATAAGLLAMLYTPPSMNEQLGATFGDLWGGYLFFGGLGCLIGVLVDSWLPEFLFLHPLGSALTVYGVVVLASTRNEPGRAAGGLLLLAFSGVLFVLWLARYRTGRADAIRARRDE